MEFVTNFIFIKKTAFSFFLLYVFPMATKVNESTYSTRPAFHDLRHSGSPLAFNSLALQKGKQGIDQ